MLGPHHAIPVRRRRVERRQMAPLLRDRAGDLRLPQRLDVLQPRLPGEGRRYRDVVHVDQPAVRQAAVGWHREVVLHELLHLDRHQTTVVRRVSLWWRRHSPCRRNPDHLDPALLVAVVALAAQQGSHVKAMMSLAVLLHRPDTGAVAVHVSFMGVRGDGRWWNVCVDRRQGRWWDFKGGRGSGAWNANGMHGIAWALRCCYDTSLGTPAACMAPCGHCDAATRRRFTAAQCIDACRGGLNRCMHQCGGLNRCAVCRLHRCVILGG